MIPELPWDQPTLDQREYVAWRDQETERVPGPWKRVENLPLALLRKVLAPSPPKRYTISQIRNHLWFKKQFKDSGNYDKMFYFRTKKLFAFGFRLLLLLAFLFNLLNIFYFHFFDLKNLIKFPSALPPIQLNLSQQFYSANLRLSPKIAANEIFDFVFKFYC